MFKVPEKYRLTTGPLPSNSCDGNNGLFIFNYKKKNKLLIIRCIASDGEQWEHVSVTLQVQRCPTWDEMCFVKSIFWDDADMVIQYHPPEKNYVNFHKYCLHLWRPIGKILPMPPSNLVGPK